MIKLNEETYRLKDEGSMLSPQLMYYVDMIERNIQTMTAMAGGVEYLWPHIKTHKSRDLVKLLMAHGILRFKCATIAEGEMVGACGARQAILSYPLVGPNIERFVRLTRAFPGTEYFAIGDDLGQITLLSEEAVRSGTKVEFLLDVNDGLNRTGVPTAQAGAMYRAATKLPGIRVRGMHVYDGHRHEHDASERQQHVDEDLVGVYGLRDELMRDGLDCGIMVMGGTPSFPCHTKYDGVYYSPGTCVLEDYGYASDFADLPFSMAAILLTRVISHPSPGIFTVDLGYKAVAADPAIPRAVIIGYEDAETIMQNEEHWVLRMPEGREDERPAVGRALYAVPKHICPTSALYPSVPVIRDGQVVEEWAITARNRRLTI